MEYSMMLACVGFLVYFASVWAERKESWFYGKTLMRFVPVVGFIDFFRFMTASYLDPLTVIDRIRD